MPTEAALRPPLVFVTTLAEYQTSFWAAVGVELERRGYQAVFFCFDDPSYDDLRCRGLAAYNVFDLAERGQEAEDAFDRYGVTDVNRWLSHERLVFGIRDSRVLRSRLARYLAGVDRGLQDATGGGRPGVMVQELGGFLSVIAAYHAARARGIDNWFVEPSFFRGRLFFTRNSFAAPVIEDRGPVPDRDPELDAYLDRTLSTGAIVIPQKDRHHYRGAARKILDPRNVRRFVRKTVDKYVLGRRREFGHVWQYAGAHLRMAVASMRLRRHYVPLDEGGRFVYYPLHVPGDVALTLRSPEYLDQLSLIDFLARAVPDGYRVVVKEHPAQIGALDPRRITALLRRYDSVSLVAPETGNFEVLRRASAVVSVNSKSGAEALLVGTPVIVLGDAFYAGCSEVVRVRSLAELPGALREVLGGGVRPKPDAVRAYFQRVWGRTRPGELYVPTEANARVFTASLVGVLESPPA